MQNHSPFIRSKADYILSAFLIFKKDRLDRISLRCLLARRLNMKDQEYIEIINYYVILFLTNVFLRRNMSNYTEIIVYWINFYFKNCYRLLIV